MTNIEKVYIEKNMCSGCTACMNVCPVNAIEMHKDDEGFLYPTIIQEKCIDCGMCNQICSFKRESINCTKIPKNVLGIKVKNPKERMTSRSGGAFISLANYILHEKGAIYGCVLGKNLDVYHTRYTEKKEVDKFKGSKYVKSDLKDAYEQVKNDLEQGEKVLFSGTPCEIAGLNAALKNIDTSNLYTCDIICHGAPSPLLYRDFINYMENKEKNKVIHIDFRDKSFGWSAHKETLTFKNNKKITTQYYTKLFYSHYVLRPSCYNCQFSNMDRVSDITIGDFWGIEKENVDFYDEKGVSVVLINTEKGQQLINKVIKEVEYIIVNSESYIQPNLQAPTKKPIDREKFWEEYREKGFEYILKKVIK